MKTKIFIMGLVYLFIVSINFLESEEIQANFRQTKWGMTKEQIKEIETSEFFKKEKGSGEFVGFELLIYRDNIIGLDSFVVYYFAENQLTRGRYLIAKKHSNKNLFISDFKNIKNEISQKYGTPKKDDIIWLNNLYKDDPSDYGTAISIGHLRYLTNWDLSNTEINLILAGDNCKIIFWIEYIGKFYKELEKEISKKAKRDIW